MEPHRPAGRYCHTATLLPDGRVLLAGGIDSGFLDSAELYDPAAGEWSPAGVLANARAVHTATLLPDGRVLLAGGLDAVGKLDSAELYDRGLGFQEAWRPALTAATSPLLPSGRLALAGSGWRGYGYAEASGGGTNSSASNVPLVQLRRLDNQQLRWLTPDPDHPFSATAFTALPLARSPAEVVPAGHYLVTVFVNGIPSVSRLIVVRCYRIYLPLLWRSG